MCFVSIYLRYSSHPERRAVATRPRAEKNPENNGSKDEANILWILRRVAPQNDSVFYWKDKLLPLIKFRNQPNHPSVYRVTPQENAIPTEIFPILLILFLATLVRSTFGFGEALVAVPLLALCIPLTVAAPLAVLVSITIAAIVVAQDWKQIHLRSAGWLTGSTILGIPFGILLLQHGHPRIIKAALALVILAFAAYALRRRISANPVQDQSPTHEPRRWLIVFGFFAGVMGGAFGMNGPPLVLYGSLRRWSPAQFRATLQAYFLPASIVGIGGYWATGLWTSAVTHDYLLALPVILPTVWLGRWLHHRIPAEAFQKYVYLGLGVIGIILLLQALHK